MEREQKSRNPARRGWLSLLATLLICAAPVWADDFATPWIVLPWGGECRTNNAGFILSGAFSDTAAGAPMSSEDFELAPGGWAVLNAVAPPCGGDLNGDFLVDLQDLVEVLINYSRFGVPPWDGDLDGDGQVTLQDLTMVLINYGHVCNSNA